MAIIKDILGRGMFVLEISNINRVSQKLLIAPLKDKFGMLHLKPCYILIILNLDTCPQNFRFLCFHTPSSTMVA